MELVLQEPVENSEIAYHLGAIYYSLGNEQEAVRYLNMAVEIRDDERAATEANSLLEMIDQK
jgi:hypothetical protein